MPDQSARTLLIYPPSQTQSHLSCPMGLLMLAAVLEDAGHDVHLLDANATRKRLSNSAIVEEAERLHPDVIGMTLLTPLVRQAYELASRLRASGAKLIAGGPHATLVPEEPLQHGFDAVVVGEGEPTIVEAIRAVRGSTRLETVKGIVYRTPDGQTRRNEPRPLIADLDTLPTPARHLVRGEHYGARSEENVHANIFTSRGCPARCAYCAGGLFGKNFRFRSADGVVNEMIAIHQRYGTRHFFFMDDAMTMNRERMARICRRMINERLGFTWNMMTRIDSVDKELLAHASDAGCVQIEYGIESGNPETLKRIHKPHTVEMVRRAVRLTHAHGIRSVAFFILGFPWEDVDALDRTLQLMKELSPYVVFHPAIASVLIPFPGTEIYDRYKDEYGFANWWLNEDRTQDASQLRTLPVYQWILRRFGAPLDTDFFRYSPEVKAKICQALRLMYAKNHYQKGFLVRKASLFALDLSRALYAISPKLERVIFSSRLGILQRLKKGYNSPH